MKKRRFDIEIPSPCAQAWDEMDAERGANGAARFCNQCQEDVYDISSMTRREAEAFMEAHRWQVCVNYEIDDEGKIIYAPEPPSRWARQLDGALRLAAAAALVVPLSSACDEAPEQVEPTASTPIEISSEGAKIKVDEADVDPGAGRSPSFPTQTTEVAEVDEAREEIAQDEVDESKEEVACDGIEDPDNTHVRDRIEDEQRAAKETSKKEGKKEVKGEGFSRRRPRLGGKPSQHHHRPFGSGSKTGDLPTF